MPDATLYATLDHGSFADSKLIDAQVRAETAAALTQLPDSVSLDEVTATLERDGVASFIAAYEELLALVETKLNGTPQ